VQENSNSETNKIEVYEGDDLVKVATSFVEYN
jgi:hypothetical protein